MQNIQPFIDLGWHTVPLRGKLERLEDGTKTVPRFEEGWRAKYQQEFNKVATPLGGVITGEVSGIIAIDCDNDVAWNLFRALDPEYEAVFKSKGKLDKEGKEKNCGTIIYKYAGDIADTFSINDGILALDVYGDKGFVYLPTTANGTKDSWSDASVEFRDAPSTVAALLKQLFNARDGATIQAAPAVTNVITANCLAPLVKQFNASNKILPGLFKIITPKDFRDLPQYVNQGFLHPESIPEGRGSEYLSKVSAIFGADISIDEELYSETMHSVNNLFSDPMAKTRLDKTIIEPMLNGKSSINGVPIWKYDKDWEQFRLVLPSKRQSNMELCFDDIRNLYYVVDSANETIRSFGRDSELMAYIEAAAVSVPKKAEVKRSLPMVNVRSEPNKPFGFNAGDDPTARTLNTFRQTPELAIMSNPESYAQMYKHPKTTLRFLETLIPEEEMRDFLVQFTKRKLTTFEYSPVVLYFLGVHGSGKDTFVKILEQMLGHVARPTTREFLEMFNGWLCDSYFVQLDEYGNQLTKVADKEEALGKLKLYTGKQNVQIRQMRTDGFIYKHNATFIMTANRNPLMLEDGDRRVALLPTPNVLMEQEWIIEMGGMSVVHEKIMSETRDFAYYLATEVPMLPADQYMKPPESKDKRRLVADSMYAAQRLAYALKHGMQDYLVELCEDFSASNTEKAIKSGFITTSDLEELYEAMTDFNGDMRSLTKVIRGSGIAITPTTKDGSKAYRIEVPWANRQEDTWDNA